MRIQVRRSKVDSEKIVNAIVANPSLRVLRRVKQVKAFVEAVADGKSNNEARAIAHISNNSRVLTTSLARVIIKEMVDKQFGNNKYVKKLRQFWNAHDVRVTKQGAVYRTPNWHAQLEGFDRVTKIRDIIEDEPERQPQGVTIQIVGEGNVQLNDQIP